MTWFEALKKVARKALEKAHDYLCADDCLVWRVILYYLGEDRAITSRAVAAELGWTGPSDDIRVRHSVERLTRAGLPICSTRRRGGGFYLPASDDDFLAAIAPIRSEAAKRWERVDALEATRDRIRIELEPKARPSGRRHPHPEPKAQLDLV